MERCWYYKTLWGTAPSEVTVFLRKSLFLTKINLNLISRSGIQASKSTRFVWQGCFFFHCYYATSTPNWVKIFTGLLFCVYVEIHQVRRLVFDNYQVCPVLSKLNKIRIFLVRNKIRLTEVSDPYVMKYLPKFKGTER